MEDLSALAKEIIALLIFEEPFDHIIAETHEPNKHAVKDELIYLIVKDIVKPVADISSGQRNGFIYDSDHMREFSYSLTAKGFTHLEAIMKEGGKQGS